MRDLYQDIADLLIALRQWRSNGVLSIALHAEIMARLDKVDASAGHLDTLLDVAFVERQGSSDDPYVLYTRLNNLCDALIAGEDAGNTAVNIRSLRDEMIRATAMAATLGHRLQRAEHQIRSHVEAVAHGGENVVSFSEWQR